MIFPKLTPESDIASNDDRFYVAEVVDVVHDLLCVGVRHRLAEGLLALEIQDRGDAVLVVWAELDNAELLQTVLCPGVLDEGHVCGMVVVEVERGTVLARVEDDRLSTFAGHCDLRIGGVDVYEL